MKILLVGALSWNPERIISLYERGHALFGLWTRSMAWEQGPYEFSKGYITDLSLDNYARAIRDEKIEIIYSLFQVYDSSLWTRANNGTPPDIWTCMRRIMKDRSRGLFDIPIVRHWGFDVHNIDPSVVEAIDGHIYCNKEMYLSWVASKADGGLGIDLPWDGESHMIMDGDLPKDEFLNDHFERRLSETDGEIHTVCVGRPIGIDYMEAAKRGIHIHLYGNNYNDTVQILLCHLSLGALRKLLGTYIHVNSSLQATVDLSLDAIRERKNRWVSEFSKYDAGWSYIRNGKRGFWNNKAAIPNRLSTYIMAGLPVISERLPGFYRYDVLSRNSIAIIFEGYDDLREKLLDRQFLNGITERVRSCRNKFTFDHHIDRLISYFEKIIKIYYSKPLPQRRRFLSSARPPINIWSKPPLGVRSVCDRIRRLILLSKKRCISHLIRCRQGIT